MGHQTSCDWFGCGASLALKEYRIISELKAVFNEIQKIGDERFKVEIEARFEQTDFFVGHNCCSNICSNG